MLEEYYININKGELTDYISKLTGVSKATANIALSILLTAVKHSKTRATVKSHTFHYVGSSGARDIVSQRVVLSAGKKAAARKVKVRGELNAKKVFGAISSISSVRQPTKGLRVRLGNTKNRINRSQLVCQVMSSAGVSKAEATRALNGAFAATRTAIQKRDQVSLVGSGSFYVTKDSAPTGRNPRARVPINLKTDSPKSDKAEKELVTDSNTAPYTVVKLFFGTDRKYSKGASKPYEYFKNSREHYVHYGSCEVSIPRDPHHEKGKLEAPYILRHYLQNPEKHVVLMSISLKSKDDFFNEVSQESVQVSKRKALIFIHGFNNSFEDVARRTAQIAYDSEFSGVPIFYSWPSKGKLGQNAYNFDGNEVQQAISYLKEFLRDIATKGGFDSITLIAHSMGNRALTEAFISLKNELKVTELKVFKEIILAAPDIDADYFRNSIAPALANTNTTTTTTLYASSKDLALIKSKKYNGAPRAGDSGAGLVVLDGIETIDATNADTNLFWGANHAYIADSKELLTDLFLLIEKGMRACERFGLAPIPTKEHPKYWKLKK